MFRIIFRLLSLFLLAFAVMYVVIDASRTIAGSGFMYSTFQETLFQLIPLRAEQFIAWSAETLPEFVNDILLATVLNCPTFIIAALLAFIFYIFSRRTRRSIGRFSLD